MGLLETTAKLAKLAGKIANPELVQEAFKANSEALALSRENLELQSRIVEMQKVVDGLQGELDLTKKVYRLTGFVFLDGDPDPCCPACWDNARKLIHILQSSVDRCPICGVQYFQEWPQNPSRNEAGAVPVS